MPIPAGVECHGLVGAVIALFDVGAERGGLACADVSENSKLMVGNNIAPSFEKFLFVLAKDIGDFKPMVDHFCRPSSPPWIGFSWRASKGLGVACSRAVDTRKYRAVV